MTVERRKGYPSIKNLSRFLDVMSANNSAAFTGEASARSLGPSRLLRA
jgi:hypothetical protein